MSFELDALVERLRKQEASRSGLDVSIIRKRHEEEVKKNGYFLMGSFKNMEMGDRISVILHMLPQNNNPRHLLHKHDYFELMYVYRGQCENRLVNESMPLSEGDILLLNPATAHCPVTCSEGDCLFNILISINYLKDSINVLLHDNALFSDFFVNCIFRARYTEEYIHFHADASARAAIERLILEYFGRNPCYETVIQSLLIELFAYLVRSCPVLNPPELLPQEKLSQSIYFYIQNHPNDVTLHQLAQRYQLSESHLSRMIKQQMGKNFSDLVQEAKMKKAGYFLENENLSIMDIAFMCGFGDLSYFYRVFRSYYGVPPAAYRKQRQEKASQINADTMEKNRGTV